MIEIEINNIKYNSPSAWEDLTFEEYCKVFYDLDDNIDNIDSINIKNEVKIFSRLLNIEEDIILNAPIPFYNRLREFFSFIYAREQFYFTDADNELIVDGIVYRIPNNDELTLRQHIDIDITTQEEDSPTKYIELLAIMLIPTDGNYTGDAKEREILMGKIKHLKCTECFKLLGFFLLKEKLLNELTATCTLMAQEIDQLVQHTQISLKTTIGNT